MTERASNDELREMDPLQLKAHIAQLGPEELDRIDSDEEAPVIARIEARVRLTDLERLKRQSDR